MAVPAGVAFIDGEMDAAYLAAALKRAGRVGHVDRMARTPFDDGRSAAPVYAVASSAGRHAVKVFPRRTWWSELSGIDCIEVELWSGGTTRSLPSPLVCPTIDVAFHRTRDEYWMLMDDVSAGITPRGEFDEVRSRWLLDGLAQLHARYWESESLDRLPLWPMERRAEYFGDAIAAAGGRIPARGWIGISLEKIELFRALLPVFLDTLGPADADFYLTHCADRGPWLATLAGYPSTLTQGDVRRANFAAFAPDHVSLFDWDYATRAPAAHDVAWYWYLQFWCYPPADGRCLEDREELRFYYRDRLNEALGDRLDPVAFEAAFDLSWLSVLAEIGFVLVDPLTGTPNDGEKQRVLASCRRAMDRAKRTYDTHVR
jgi:hypothetical protein